jgi:hypothetical protein
MPTQVEPLLGLKFRWVSVLTANIRLGWKWLVVTYDKAYITVIVVTAVLGVYVIKLFSSAICERTK